MKKLLSALMVVSLWSAAAMAQAPAWNEDKGELKAVLEAKGDVKRGEASFEQCVGCHRADASGRVSGAYPRLSGQHANVLKKQIVDIRSGLRNNPKMVPFIGDHVLDAFQIADVATYLSGLPISEANGKGPGTLLAKGKELFEKDCAECHGAKGQGSDPKFYPMVAGQHFKYLLRESTFIRDGDRRNANPDMVKVIKPYTSGDLEAVSDYMASLAAPKK
jgi:cytochrome c553